MTIKDDFKKAYHRNYNNSNPWMKTYRNIQSRCRLPKNHRNYKWYGAKGIKNFLKPSDLKILWIRDSAGSMKSPSIDRIDPNQNYTMENCRYLEIVDNARHAHKSHKKIVYLKTMVCVKCNKRKLISKFRLKGVKNLPHLRHKSCNNCLNIASEKFRRNLPEEVLKARNREYAKKSYKLRQLAKELQ